LAASQVGVLRPPALSRRPSLPVNILGKVGVQCEGLPLQPEAGYLLCQTSPLHRVLPGTSSPHWKMSSTLDNNLSCVPTQSYQPPELSTPSLSSFPCAPMQPIWTPDKARIDLTFLQVPARQLCRNSGDTDCAMVAQYSHRTGRDSLGCKPGCARHSAWQPFQTWSCSPSPQTG
jgi:hypothetical protein